MREAKLGGRDHTAASSTALPCGKFSYSNFDNLGSSEEENSFSTRNSTSSSSATPSYFSDRSNDSSPYIMSPWNQQVHESTSPYNKSPWSAAATGDNEEDSDRDQADIGLIGSLVREEGHVYSLAAAGALLYTGSDSKNIRVWKKQKEFAGFKSSSGFVKAIVISVADGRVFTGHQDGKIRIWKASPKNPATHKRVGSMPRFKDFLKSSMKPSNYVEIRKKKAAVWIRHSDAVSCLSLHEQQGILYSGSWDKTFKVWRLVDSKCLESVTAHDDAVNSIVSGFDGLVFTGSADGTVKAWKRELKGKGTHHTHVQTLLKHDCAVTALAVSPTAPVVYCGSSDGLLNFWEGERQLAHSGVLRGHNQAVLCLTAAGSLVLSGSADATIYVWRREGSVHSCLSVLKGHTGPVKCLAAVEEERSENGAGDGAGKWIVYSGSLDKSVKVWRVSEQPSEALLRGPQHVPMETAADSYHADQRARIWAAA